MPMSSKKSIMRRFKKRSRTATSILLSKVEESPLHAKKSNSAAIDEDSNEQGAREALLSSTEPNVISYQVEDKTNHVSASQPLQIHEDGLASPDNEVDEEELALDPHSQSNSDSNVTNEQTDSASQSNGKNNRHRSQNTYNSYLILNSTDDPIPVLGNPAVAAAILERLVNLG